MCQISAGDIVNPPVCITGLDLRCCSLMRSFDIIAAIFFLGGTYLTR